MNWTMTEPTEPGWYWVFEPTADDWETPIMGHLSSSEWEFFKTGARVPAPCDDWDVGTEWVRVHRPVCPTSKGTDSVPLPCDICGEVPHDRGCPEAVPAVSKSATVDHIAKAVESLEDNRRQVLGLEDLGRSSHGGGDK